MIDDDLRRQVKEEVAAIDETRVLLGLMQEPQAMRWMKVDHSVRNRWGPQLSEDQKNEALEEKREEFEEVYEKAKSGLKDPPNFSAREVDLKELPEAEAVEEHISEFTDGDYFQEAFNSVSDAMWDVKLVPLRALVAYQSHVTTAAHQDIPTSDDGIMDLLEYCLPTDAKNFLHINGQSVPDQSTTLSVVSRNPNVNFVGPEITEIEGRPAGSISVTFDIKPRPNFIQVVRFNNRYILKNGYHRCFQLLQAGEEYVPAVVRYAQNYEQTGAPSSGWFTKEMIFGPRPPLVRDFLSEAAVNLEKKSTNKMIRIHAEKMDVER